MVPTGNQAFAVAGAGSGPPCSGLLEGGPGVLHRVLDVAHHSLDALHRPQRFMVDDPIGPPDRLEAGDGHKIIMLAGDEGMQDANARARSHRLCLPER